METTLLKNLSRLKELSNKKLEPSVLQVRQPYLRTFRRLRELKKVGPSALQVRQTFPIETLAALKVLVWLSFCLLGLLYLGIKERVNLKTSLNEVKWRLKRWRVPIGSNYLSKSSYYIQCINQGLTRSLTSAWPGMTSMNFNERVLTFESVCLT